MARGRARFRVGCSPARVSGFGRQALSPDRVDFDIEADSPVAAVRQALERMPPGALPLPVAQILKAVEERERLVGT